jgi:hypothetical protein
MSYLLQLHPLVQQDYNEAYKWYEDQQKGLGERFLKAVRGKIEQIIEPLSKTFPLLELYSDPQKSNCRLLVSPCAAAFRFCYGGGFSDFNLSKLACTLSIVAAIFFYGH